MLAMLRVRRTRAAVGGHVDDLADVGAVEVERVGAALALDDVVAVAGIPLEVVVAAAEEGRVGAAVAVDEVVAVTAEQLVGAVAAEDVSSPSPPSIVRAVSAARLPTAAIVSPPPRPSSDEALDPDVSSRDVERARSWLPRRRWRRPEIVSALGGAAVARDVGAVAAVDVDQLAGPETLDGRS